MNNKNAIILMSGGLDSLVSLASAKKTNYNIKKALHFNYGQDASQKEIQSSKKICEYYDINLEIISLEWFEKLINSIKIDNSYWIPNRNGLFVNIAATYAEALNCKTIIIGANKEEAKKFKDNSEKFIKNSISALKTSTQNEVELLAPLINKNKKEIIKMAIQYDVPLQYVWSCYNNNEKHCGNCPSCLLLKQALFENDKNDLQKILF